MMSIRYFRQNDIDILTKWLNNNYVRDFFGEPNDWICEITENLNNSDWIHYYIVEQQDIPFGFFQYYETDKAPKGVWSNEPAGTVEIDFLIGEKSFLKKGLGSQLILLIINEIMSKDKYNFIVADPNTKNGASIRVLKKNGFYKIHNKLYCLKITV